MIERLLLGVVLSAAIGGLGYWRQSLSASGVAGAVIVGTLIFGFGGLDWGLLLILFFVSSSALSRFRASAKAGVAEKFAKGGRRDLGQALANGGWGALLALAAVLWPGGLWMAAFVGAMATVNADTWATEIGVTSRALPRLITSGKPVAAGTSGGVSALGTGAALAGAALIGAFAALFAALGGAPQAWVCLAIGAVGGLAGSLVDSVLGATVQGIYYCDACGKETERRVHRCGDATRLVRGRAFLNNDWVNFLASVAGSGVAAGLALLL